MLKVKSVYTTYISNKALLKHIKMNIYSILLLKDRGFTEPPRKLLSNIIYSIFSPFLTKLVKSLKNSLLLGEDMNNKYLI